MYPMIRQRLFAVAAIMLCGLFYASALQAQLGSTRYRVTITNLTKAQILSPAVVATHAETAPMLFELGEPASEALAKVAEDADAEDLLAMLGSAADVLDVQVAMGAAGPIMPGESASVELDTIFSHRWVSAVSMLVTTNDSFMAIRHVRGPNVGAAVHFSPAYDAGSEANTQSCEHIPGPPCGQAGVRMTDGAEGYVYVSPGFVGDDELLTPYAYDWRNPVAKIAIERIR